MTRSEIINLVKILTEKKLEQSGLNFNDLFRLVIQDFCGQSRFWWRQMSVAFSIGTSANTYDTTAGSFGTPSIAEIAVEEITSMAVLNPGAQPTFLVPVFDPEVQIQMRTGIGLNGSVATPGAPSRYMMDFNDYKTLRFDAVDATYSMLMTFWGMPDPRTESASDAVPLVPPWHHKAIVHGMEAEIWRSVYGPKNDKYITAKAKYDADTNLAQARPRHSTNYVQQMKQSDKAIRST